MDNREKGINESILYADTEPQVVNISFTLPYRGWCLLKDSNTWRQVAEYIDYLQHPNAAG